jgi:hypothetical protein
LIFSNLFEMKIEKLWVDKCNVAVVVVAIWDKIFFFFWESSFLQLVTPTRTLDNLKQHLDLFGDTFKREGKKSIWKNKKKYFFWFWIFLWTVMHFDTSHMLINWKQWNVMTTRKIWQKWIVLFWQKITFCKNFFFFSYQKDYLDQVVLFTLMVQNPEFIWMMFCVHQAFTFSMLRYQLLWWLTPTYFNSPFLFCSVYPLSFFLT